MIVRQVGGVFYADREWLALTYRVSTETIRKRLAPARTDYGTGRTLYAITDDTQRLLTTLKPRRRRSTPIPPP